MSEGRNLFLDYVTQRRSLGEGRVILDAPLHIASQSTAAPRALSPTPGASPGEPKWLRGAPDIPPAGLVIPSPSKDLFVADPLGALSLDQVAERIAECHACDLCKERKKTVPGQGNPAARLVLVGEGPGANEDEQGLAFVGRAGQLLTEILAAIDLPREQVFIVNIVKCRPPGNRKPLPDEIAKCLPFLYRQLELIRPSVILALGATAAETLLNTRQSLSQLRQLVHDFRGTPLVVTYHPAALLRNPNWKKPTWDDVRIARRLLDAR